MKVNFPGGYCGRETLESYIPPGQEYELSDDDAAHLIGVGLAEEIEEIEEIQPVVKIVKTVKRSRAKPVKESADEA